MKHPKMLEPTRTVAPATPAVYLAEIKHHLHIDGNDDDGYLAGLIRAAEDKIDGPDGDLGQALITQTWRVDYDKFPRKRRLDLPLGPVQSVTVNYSDADNAEQTLAASKYAVHEDASGPFLFLDEGEDTWPDTFDREDAVRITTVVGYGDNPSDVPQGVRHAILIMAGVLHRHRDEDAPMPAVVKHLLANERRLGF